MDTSMKIETYTKLNLTCEYSSNCSNHGMCSACKSKHSKANAHILYDKWKIIQLA